jgi:non-homologous end joining protein Ku
VRPFSCPIALHAACSTAECVALRQINKVTGNDDHVPLCVNGIPVA